MSREPWWNTLSTASLLSLREQLAVYVRATFGKSLPDEVEDIVQQAFVALYAHRKSVDPEDDGLIRFLKTTARNLALDRIRSTQRRQRHQPQIINHLGKPPDTPEVTRLEIAEESDRIGRIFCALDELDRLVLWNHAVEGKSIRAIARELNLNWHRVAMILYRTLRSVRQSMED